jgi:hypothetical protein
VLTLALTLVFALSAPAMAGNVTIPVSNNVHTFSVGKFDFDLNQTQVQLVYRLDRNVFNGRANVQLHILHLQHDLIMV